MIKYVYIFNGTHHGANGALVMRDAVPSRDIDASRFCSLQTRSNGGSEINYAPESDPLIDASLALFAVNDSIWNGDDKPSPDDLPGPQAMREFEMRGPGRAGRGAYVLGS